MRLGLMRCATALALAGCGGFDAGGDGDFMDDDLPMSNCSGSGTGGVACPQTSGGGLPAGSACTGSGQCEGDLHCIAPFDGENAGDLFCAAQCIALEDEAWWCLDDSACCDAQAICTPRGLCVMGEALDDTMDATSASTTGDDDFATSTTEASSGTADPQTTDTGGDSSSTSGGT